MNLAAEPEEAEPKSDIKADKLDPNDEDGNIATSKLINEPIFLSKHKSYTPVPQKRTHSGSYHVRGLGSAQRRPFILGISGGPSSGMSTVAHNIQTELQKSNISVSVVNLSNFYRPIRGNLRKNRSRAGSLVDEENKEEVLREIQVINETTDFDDPKQIDFELLIVSGRLLT